MLRFPQYEERSEQQQQHQLRAGQGYLVAVQRAHHGAGLVAVLQLQARHVDAHGAREAVREAAPWLREGISPHFKNVILRNKSQNHGC